MDPGAIGIDGARCVEHRERKASIVCKLCGDYACSECTIDTLWGATLCARCQARGRATYPLPWLRSMSPASWIATSRAVLAEARVVFEHFPDGGALRACAYALGWLVPLLTFKAAVVALRPNAVDGSSGLWISLGLLGVERGLWVCCIGAGLFIATRLLGARAALSESVAAAAYVSAFTSLASIVSQLPIAGLLAMPINMLALYFTLWPLSLLARTRYAFSRKRSIVAALLAFVLGLGLLAVVGFAGALLLPDSDH